MNLQLDRAPYGPSSTVGVLYTDTQQLHAIEPPWLDNRPGHSCIPEGVYGLVPYDSPKHGPTYCFRNPDLKIMGHDVLTEEQIADGYRTVCEIHPANFAIQLEGCCAVGYGDDPMFDWITGKTEPAVEDSQKAFKALMAELGVGVHGHTIDVGLGPHPHTGTRGDRGAPT